MENYDNPKRKNYREKNIHIEYEKDRERNDKEKKEKKIEDIIIDMKKAAKQSKLMLEGIEVYFPYEPYECQTVYMTKVIQALNGGSLAALESPTGTGKTLCLLCASLAWLKHKRSELKKFSINPSFEIKIPFIYYTSRTHSQISNVIKELKKTCYKPRTAILSSRDNLCINSIVKNGVGANINLKCKIARTKKECKFFQNSESIKTSGFDCIDIEELKTIAEQSSFCPFYFQRKKKDYADIIFLPYNYIFEKKLLNILKINLDGSALLIDEAHNIEKVCEDSHSSELSTKTIDSCLDDLKNISIILEKRNDSLTEFPQFGKNKQDTKEDFLRSIDKTKLHENENILISLKNYLKSLDVKQGSWPNIGKRFSPKDLFDMIFEGSKKQDPNQSLISGFISKAGSSSGNRRGFNPNNLTEHIGFLKLIDEGINQEFNKNSNLSAYVDFLTLINDLHLNYIALQAKQSEIYKVENDYDCMINNYKIFVLDEEENNGGSQYGNIQRTQRNRESSNIKVRKISLFCLNPGLGFKHILDSGVASTILTSGTLSPLNSMEAELKCEFKIKLENKHVINPKQVNFSILKNSLDTSKTVFDFRANNRGFEMNEKLGHVICDLIKVTPPGTGVLCFFTSYAFMQSCIETWGKKSILSEMEKTKEIFKDVQNPRSKTGNIIQSFNDACGDGLTNKRCKGAILFSVFRGVSSEGIDFSDEKARMVIIVGIPYPNLGDMKVNLKKEFLDEYARRPHKIPSLKLKSTEWYLQSALKAVNQALGRVIRHTYDFGSMVLIDTRYKELVNQNAFSKWLRENHRVYEDKILLESNKNFFDEMKTFIKQRKINDKKKIKNETEALAPADSSDNEIPFNNNLNNFEKLNHDIEEGLINGNIGKKISKRDLDTGEKLNNNATSANNNFSWPINSINKTNNKSNIGNKSGNMSFMKTIGELEESLSKNAMKNLLNNTNKDYSFNKNDIFGETIKKNLNDEFSRNNNEPNASDSSNKMHIEEEMNKKSKALDTVKKNLDTNEFNKTTKITLDDFFKSNKKNKEDNRSSNIKLSSNIKESVPKLETKATNNNNFNNTNTNKINIITDNNTEKSSQVFLDLDGITEDDLNLFINEALDEEKQAENMKPKAAPIHPKSEVSDDIDWNEIDFSDIIKEESKNVNINNNFKITNPVNPLSSLNILTNNHNNMKIQPEKNSTREINVTNNINIINTFNVNTNKIIENPKINFSQISKSQNIDNYEDKNNEGNKTTNNLNTATIERANTQNNIVINNPPRNKEDKVEKDIDEIDTENLFNQLRKLKEKSNLDALFEKYKIDINIKKPEVKEESKLECPICFEKEGKQFKSAKCGHVLCSDCWSGVLKVKLECPLCKKKIREKQLANIYI